MKKFHTIRKKKKQIEIQKSLVDEKNFLPKESNSILFDEQIKNVRESIDFFLEAEKKILVITSAEKNTGNTFITSNLAREFAKNGKKTLLVDADVKNPSVQYYVHRFSEAKNSNVLFGNNINTTNIENLFVTKMLSLPGEDIEKIADSIQELRMRYDQILIDAPPVLVTSSSRIWSKNADGIILVIKRNQSDFENVKQTIKKLEQINAPIIGSIFNDMT